MAAAIVLHSVFLGHGLIQQNAGFELLVKGKELRDHRELPIPEWRVAESMSHSRRQCSTQHSP